MVSYEFTYELIYIFPILGTPTAQSSPIIRYTYTSKAYSTYVAQSLSWMESLLQFKEDIVHLAGKSVNYQEEFPNYYEFGQWLRLSELPKDSIGLMNAFHQSTVC